MTCEIGYITCGYGIIVVAHEHDRGILIPKMLNDLVGLRTVADYVAQAEKRIVCWQL